MSEVRVGSQTLAFEEHGSGRPLLLIAGLGAPRRIWWKQAGPLSRSHRLILPDNRDAGESGVAAGPYTISDMADDMAGLIAALGLGRTNVAGISMGGFVALDLALRYSTLLDRVIFVATSPGGPHHVPAGPVLEEIMERIEGEDAEQRMRRIVPLITGPGYAAAHPGDVDSYVKVFLDQPMPDDRYSRQMEASLQYMRQGLGGRLAEIAVPTLVIHGDADVVVPLANGAFLGRTIPGARLSVYEGVGHLPPVEAAEGFNNEVLEFLG